MQLAAVMGGVLISRFVLMQGPLVLPPCLMTLANKDGSN
jgi:hypothetical protein